MKRRAKEIPPAVRSRLSREIEKYAIDSARAAIAGAVLCGGMAPDLAYMLELAKPSDYAPRVPGTRAMVKAYALESCDFPALARLTVESFAGRQFVRLENFRNIGGAWQDTGHAVLEMSAARAMASEILNLEVAPPDPGEPFQ